MKTSKLSAQEIAELDEMNQQQARNKGLALMPVRDRGKATLSNGVVVRWRGVKQPYQTFELNGQIWEISDQQVPEGIFIINGVSFEAEELRKYLRWA
jgi:hypothetical protein